MSHPLDCIPLQVISVNASGPGNAASCPIDHITLHTMTELDAECNSICQYWRHFTTQTDSCQCTM